MKHVLCPVFVLLLVVNCVQAADDSTVIGNTAQVSEAKPEAEKPEVLTFRILASHAYPQDEDIIQRGVAEPGQNILDPAGKIVARWIPIIDSQKYSFENRPDMVLREREKTLEALVKYDDGVDMTGEYLIHVAREMGRGGNHVITFKFNPIGANKFGRLTSANRPDPVQNRLTRHLGIILNDSLYSAPVIRTTVRESGIVEFHAGRTEAERQKLNQEIDDLVELLRTRYSLQTEKTR